VSGDFDNAGDRDFIVGNCGIEYALQSDCRQNRMSVCFKTYHNGSRDPFLCVYENDRQLPVGSLGLPMKGITLSQHKQYPTLLH